MSEFAVPAHGDAAVEAVLRDELTHGDALIGTIAPIMRHLLANDDHSVFSDEIVARVRGMFHDIARQTLDALATAGGETERVQHPEAQLVPLVDALIAQPGLLSHLHALALEWQLTERMHARLALDPVLSPLLQALIASSEAHVAASGMALLAAQARFAQAQRRMELPLAELPADLLHLVLHALRHHAGAEAAEQVVLAEQAIRAGCDESRSRLGLIARLVTGMGGGAAAALSITHAGVGMFLSALSLASGQDRDTTVLSTNDGQLARFALALRATGLKPEAVEEQFASLHPEVSLPDGFEQLGADRAAALLARSLAPTYG